MQPCQPRPTAAHGGLQNRGWDGLTTLPWCRMPLISLRHQYSTLWNFSSQAEWTLRGVVAVLFPSRCSKFLLLANSFSYQKHTNNTVHYYCSTDSFQNIAQTLKQRAEMATFFLALFQPSP